MAFDKNLPPGNTAISIGDNSIRDNNAGIETALTAEHVFSTGGDQTGRHKFGIDTVANRNLISAWVNGSIFLATDVRTGKLVLQAYDGGAFENVDVEPGGATPTLPRLDAQSDFVTSQFSTYETITPTVDGGGPDELIAINLLLSPYKKATLAQDTTISNPINTVASKGTTVVLLLTQDGTGSHSVSFGSEYRSAGSGTPNVASAAGAKTLIHITKLDTVEYLVTTAPAIGAIP